MEELSALGLNAATLHTLVSPPRGTVLEQADSEIPAHIQYEFVGKAPIPAFLKTCQAQLNIFNRRYT